VVVLSAKGSSSSTQQHMSNPEVVHISIILTC